MFDYHVTRFKRYATVFPCFVGSRWIPNLTQWYFTCFKASASHYLSPHGILYSCGYDCACLILYCNYLASNCNDCSLSIISYILYMILDQSFVNTEGQNEYIAQNVMLKIKKCILFRKVHTILFFQ